MTHLIAGVHKLDDNSAEVLEINQVVRVAEELVLTERKRCAKILQDAIDTPSIQDPAYAWLSDALQQIQEGK